LFCSSSIGEEYIVFSSDVSSSTVEDIGLPVHYGIDSDEKSIEEEEEKHNNMIATYDADTIQDPGDTDKTSQRR
jgi:hypothetical protein